MKIQAINSLNKHNKTGKQQSAKQANSPNFAKNMPLSNVYHTPMNISFTSSWFEQNYVRKVKDKEYQGENLMAKNALGEPSWYDFSKIGWEHLSKEQLDWKETTPTEFYVFQHANALAEAVDTSWVKRFNSSNVTKPLATNHSISSRNAKEPLSLSLDENFTNDGSFTTNLIMLMDAKNNKSLDVPITDKDGNLVLDAVVFDTETTGTNVSDRSRPLDKIIQIGGIQIKDGKIIPETGYNQLINPNVPIPEGASKVHGIYNEDLVDAPTMEKVLGSFINDYLNKKNGIIVAYNSKFDISILNNTIDEHNSYSSQQLKHKRPHKVIDPFILIQRIHPYLGAKKKLSEQYKFLFCRNLDDAHDAFADVKGTVDVLKYALYYLSERRVDKTKPLTIKDVLFFQNGVIPNNLDMSLDTQGCNSDVNFKTSYRLRSVNATNYFQGYKVTETALEKIKDEIGKDNYRKLSNKDFINDEIQNIPQEDIEQKDNGVVGASYVMRKNFYKVLDLINIESYKDKSSDEIKEIIANASKEYTHKDSIDIWMKNPNPKDIKDGNDLAVFEISKRVMQEKFAIEI